MKQTEENGNHFFITNANETLCDRPYTLRGEQILQVEAEKFQPYDEKADTTTAPTTTTTSAVEVTTTVLNIVSWQKTSLSYESLIEAEYPGWQQNKRHSFQGRATARSLRSLKNGRCEGCLQPEG